MVTASWKVRSTIIGVGAGLDSANALGIIDGRLLLDATVIGAGCLLLFYVVRFIVNPA